MEKKIEEIWKPVLDYEGFYEVSDMGQVKSLYKNKLLIFSINQKGYYRVGLCKDGVRKNHFVHRLVWESFNGKTDLQIDHIIEGNKLDNRLSNLQVLTPRSNTVKNRQSLKNTSSYIGVNWDNQKQKWRAQIEVNGVKKYLGLFINELEAATAYQNALKQIK